MSKRLNWGILSTGRIAGIFAADLKHSRSGKLHAVASRTARAAADFASRHGAEKSYGDYAALLGDPAFDAIYIATPHPMHAEWAIRAAEHGKHILCEKPLALNHAEAMVVAEAAREHGVFLMEAFMYRCHPQTHRLLEILRNGRIGDVRLIEASFGFAASFDPGGRLFSQDLGGGGILDVGCYPVSMARLVAGAALGKPFAEPVDVQGAAVLGEQSRVDEWAAATLKFDRNILAQLSCAISLKLDNRLVVHGSTGRLVVSNPWIPGRQDSSPGITVYSFNDDKAEMISCETDRPLYALEADAFAEGVTTGEAPHPAMSSADTLGNMRTLDRWREAAGLVYDKEKPENASQPVSRRPLARRSNATMLYGTIPRISRRVSRLVLGVDNQRTMPHAAAMFDDFFERGGNCFDTAWQYGRGLCETLFGYWLRQRGIRDEIVIIGKGAHTPNCFPRAIEEQLLESLDRLQTGRVDVYLLHRDNPEIPAGEFVDALHEQMSHGRIGAYGASNWSMERMEEANRYAASRGLPGFACLSNNFSLARMIEPPWAGCRSASDTAYRDWLQKTQTPLLAWSSQARGFFAGRAAPEDRSDPELVRCWYSDENFQRLERARELADKKSVQPINIALSYVLNQPFPTFALVGPRSVSETREALEGLTVSLPPDEVAWLDSNPTTGSGY